MSKFDKVYFEIKLKNDDFKLLQYIAKFVQKH